MHIDIISRMPNYTLSQQQLENTWSLHKHDLLPKEKVTWKFSPTENRFGIRKDFILFWSKSYWKCIPVFHLYVAATKWPGHTCIVLPMSVIPKYFSCYHFFSLCFDDLIFGMWVYSYKLQIKFTFRSGPVIFWPSCDPWTLKFGQIFSCHHFLRHAWRYWLDCLVYECIRMRYRSNFIPVQWSLAVQSPVDFEIWPNI